MFHNAMVMVYVNHQGASGWTRGHKGIALSAVYIPRGENVAADASLEDGLSQQKGPLPRVGPVALSVDRLAPMFACHIAVVWGQEHLLTHLNALKCGQGTMPSNTFGHR